MAAFSLSGAKAAPIVFSNRAAQPVVTSSARPRCSGVVQCGRKCGAQAVELRSEERDGLLQVDFGRRFDLHQRRRRVLSSLSKNRARAPLPPRAETEKGTLGSDDHDHGSLGSENGVTFVDYPTRPVSGSPQDEGAVKASPVVLPAAGPSNRAGLFRAPISGGVQSATSSHSLPHPAIAVRNLFEQARYAHICTIMSRMHHRRRGYPFGSLVEFATDSAGHPIFSLSPLAIHTRNLLADPRCTLVVQVPGWSGLANARVTVFGDVYPIPAKELELAHKYYSIKHQQGASQQWGNFNYYRMDTISDVYFVGGFGTVAWIDVKEYENSLPDAIAANGSEQTLQELNLRFSKPLREMLSSEAEELNLQFSKSLREALSSEKEVDDAALISIDSKGVDIRVRQGAQFNVRRLAFQEDRPVETLEHASKALQKVLDEFQKLRTGPSGVSASR